MMKQADLGKRISKLRLAKGLTQGELAEKCNLSLRTIQRIESAEVTPRSYTVKLILSGLEDESGDSFGKFSYRIDSEDYILVIWLGQFFRYVLDLFNLKTHTMRKISILAAVFSLIGIGLFFISTNSNAQSISNVKNCINASNMNFVKWFNNGEIDSLLTLYRNDACLVARGCGKEFIHDYYEGQMNIYKFQKLALVSLSVSDTIAVEKGNWIVKLISGQEIKGMYLTEWRYTDKKWLMVNDISNTQ